MQEIYLCATYRGLRRGAHSDTGKRAAVESCAILKEISCQLPARSRMKPRSSCRLNGDGLAALSELLFGPRETSDILVRDRVVAVTEPTLITPARSVAERGEDLVGRRTR